MSLTSIWGSPGGSSSLGLGSTSSPFAPSIGVGSAPKSVVPTFSSAAPKTISNSKSQNPPERIDVNSIFSQATNAGLQALDVAGRAPGFTYERPIAVLDTVAQKAGLGSPVKGIEDFVGGIPILGSLIGGAGDAVANVSNFVPALLNSRDVSLLSKIPDSTPDSARLRDLGLNQAAEYGNLTVGDLRKSLGARGFTAQDIQDVRSGVKASTDFGNHSLSDNPLVDVATRLVADPTNILLGTGLLTKAAQGVGLLAKSVAAGAELRAPLALTEATKAVAAGVARDATWAGVANYMGEAASAYRKVAIGTTAAELGIQAFGPGAADLTKGTPISGWLQGLNDVNKAAMDNRPLSDNMIFSVWSAFHFPIHSMIGNVKTKVGAAAYARTGSAVIPRVVEALTEGTGITKYADKLAYVHEKLGGQDGLDQLVFHAIGSMMFRQVAPTFSDGGLSHFESLTQAVLANRTLETAITNKMAAAFESNSIRAADVVAEIKANHAFRRDPSGGGDALNKVAFPWNGDQAMQQWSTYASAAAPLGQVFRDRLQSLVGSTNDPLPVIGLTGVISKTDVSTLQVTLKAAAKNGMVPVAAIRDVLNMAPVLMKLDTKGFWEKSLVQGAPDVRLDTLMSKLGQLKKNATDLRDLTHESAAAEKAAAGPIPSDPSTNTFDAANTAVNVSPYQASAWGAKSTVAEAFAEHNRPQVQAMEHNAGQALRDLGFDVARVDQAIGGWANTREPAIEVTLNEGTLVSDRLAAAMLGRAGNQDGVLLTLSESQAKARGVKPNGVTVAWTIPSNVAADLEKVAQVLGEHFSGWTLKDGVASVSIHPDWAPADLGATADAVKAGLDAIFPGDAVGDHGVHQVIEPAYVELIGRNKDLGHVSYKQAFADASGDPRASGFNAFRARVTDLGAGSGVAGAGRDGGLLPERPVAPAGGVDNPGSLQSLFDQVGHGSPAQAVTDPGYLYHGTPATNAQQIARDALRPMKPGAAGGDIVEWPAGAPGDWPTSARSWWTREVAQVENYIPGGGVTLRVKDAGRNVNFDAVDGNPYLKAKVLAKDLEILGGDGQWHPLVGFYDPIGGTVPPQMQAAFDVIAPVVKQAVESAIPADKGVAAARDVAAAYMQKVGTPAQPRVYHPANPEFGLRTAQAYDALPSHPEAPARKTPVTQASLEKASTRLKSIDVPAEVRASYQAFVDETKAQYDAIRAAGIEVVPTLEDPYPNSAAMMADVRDNHRLKVFAGSADHPIMTNEQNVMFRAVHDFMAHAAEGFQFGPRGELNAAIKHSQMYSPLAQKAMLTETHGQNSFVNYSDRVGPDGRTVAQINQEKPGTIYAAQKAALLPQAIVDEFTSQYTTPGAALSPDARPTADNTTWAIRADQSASQVAAGEGAAATPETIKAQVLFNAQLDAAVEKVLPLTKFENGAINAASDTFKEALSPIERLLHQLGPQYTVKAGPNLHWLYDPNAAGPVMSALRDREGLALWLFHDSPFAPAARFLDWLTQPVHGYDLSKTARQAMYSELVPLGFKPKEIDAWVNMMSEQASMNTIGRTRIPFFKGAGGIPANTMNDLALRAFSSNKKALAAVGPNFRFHNVYDRAVNRFIRDIEDKSRAGQANKLQTLADALYRRYQTTPIGDASRVASKTYYHIFRFMLDPRWHAMNMLEADIIGGMMAGKTATRLAGANTAEMSAASVLHGGVGGVAERGDTGWLNTHNLSGYISRVFDAARPDSTLAALQGMDQAGFTAIRRLFPDAGSNAELVQQLDEMLYSFDTKGVGQTITDNLHHFGDVNKIREDPMAVAMVQRIWDANQQTYDDIVRTMEGNGSRSTLERLLNSYWLYWPLSYQLKAGKWMLDLLTNRALGHQTNLAGAAVYSQMVKLHNDRVQNDPAYAKVFSDNPTFWMIAQMLLPITPGDLGVSLSRPVRYGVSALKSVTGGDTGPLGFWGSYKAAQGPVGFSTAVLNLGLPYTLSLISQFNRETTHLG